MKSPDLQLGSSCYPEAPSSASASVCPGVTAHAVSSSKKESTLVASCHIMLLKQSDKNAYVPAGSPAAQGGRAA